MIADFDALLAHLGTGRWTAVIFAVACYREFFGPGQVLSGAFMAPQVNYTCHYPEGALANNSEKCTYQMMNNNTGSIETYQCDAWDFDNSTWTSTLNSEFNLGCGSAYLASSFTSVYMIGSGIGSAVNSLLCDEYGRKTMLCIGIYIYLLNNLIAWLPSMSFILVVRFLIGFGGGLIYDASNILSLEIVEPRLRPAMSMTIWVPWVLGMAVFGGLGHLFRDWRTLQFVVSLPYFLLIGIYWLLDESPRWLIVKEKRKKAVKILRKAARWQKVTLPSDAELDVVMDKCKSKTNEEEEHSNSSKLERIKAIFQRISLLFRTPRMRILTLVYWFNSVILALMYFGLSLNVVQYSNDPFIYMALSGLIELPSATITVPIVSKFGRKIPGMLFFLGAGVCLLTLPFLPKDLKWLSMALALIAKGLNTMAFAAFALQCTELFPTEVRLLGMGSGRIMASVGSSLSAYVNDSLAPLAPWAPPVLFGSTSLLAIVAMYQLPETKGVPMPDTIPDLENIDYAKFKRKYNSKVSEIKMTQSYTSLPSQDNADNS